MKPTEQQLQDIYEEAVSAECAEKQGEEMSSFDLLCRLDEVGGLAHFIRTMIEMARAGDRQQEPVVVTDDMAYAFHNAFSDSSLGDNEVEEIKTGLRAALANFTTPPVPSGADREMLKRLAVIMSGSDSGGEIAALTVTAQSFVDRCKTLAKERDALRLAGGQPQRDMPLSVRANGEANSYTLLRDGNWFANILMNGEMTVPQQWDFLNTIAKKQ